MTTQPPSKHIITKIGLAMLALLLVDFVYVILIQKSATGAFFADSSGWASPLWARKALLFGIPVALLVLLVGAIIDSLRYSRWRKSTA